MIALTIVSKLKADSTMIDVDVSVDGTSFTRLIRRPVPVTMWVWSPCGEDENSSEGLTSNSAKFCTSKNFPLYGSCLQQMTDLHSLYADGALTDNKFSEQKMPILEQLIVL